jgi:hypothetical protein
MEREESNETHFNILLLLPALSSPQMRFEYRGSRKTIIKQESWQNYRLEMKTFSGGKKRQNVGLSKGEELFGNEMKGE